MEAFLQELLPGLLDGETSFEVHPFQCKADLLGRLPARLKGYSRWLPKDWRIIVIVDCDNDACHTLKNELERMALEVGLSTRSNSQTTDWQIVNRIAIEELEAWYFGEWDAVCKAYPRVPTGISAKTKFRDSDAIQGGTWEALERTLQKAGYFKTGLRKIEAARAIGKCLDATRNNSRSFQVFRDAVYEATR